MESLKNFLLNESKKFDNYVQYLNSLKNNKAKFDEFKKIMSDEFMIDDCTFDDKEHKIEAVYNFSNNAEKNDTLLTINVKGNENGFTILDFDTEDL